MCVYTNLKLPANFSMLTPDTRSHSHRYQCHDITSHSATSVDRWKSFVHVLKSTALFHCSLNCCSEVWMSFEINSTGNTLVVSLPVSCFHGKNLFLINQCRASSSLIYAILIRLLQIERKMCRHLQIETIFSFGATDNICNTLSFFNKS